MKAIRLLLLVLAVCHTGAAHAQRALVPVVNFENIPVTLATPAALTAEQVRDAFVAAAEDANWEMTPAGEGRLDGKFVKQNKHTVLVSIRYDAEKYSVTYAGSINMKKRPNPEDPAPAGAASFEESRGARAARKQRELFAARPESPYAKPDLRTVIHPFYERWVYDLLAEVRLSLKRAK